MPPSSTPSEIPALPARPTLFEIFRLFLITGAVSFGGGVVAYQREYLVSRSGWLTDEDFLTALEISETLPGLNSVNIAVIAGDDLRGVAGAAAAVAGLMLPGIIVVMTLGILWDQSRHDPRVGKFLLGIAAAAAGLLLVVTLQLGQRQFRKPLDLVFVVGTFFAVSIFKVSLAWVLLIAAPLAIFLYRPHPARPPSAPGGQLDKGPRRGKLRY